MVRNHVEIVRRKPRMVVNYKKLSDGYFLPHKDSLINGTKGKNIFSKFNCKSGFCQIKMHKNSIIVISSPQGQYEWLVKPFGLKNMHPKYF